MPVADLIQCREQQLQDMRTMHLQQTPGPSSATAPPTTAGLPQSVPAPTPISNADAFLAQAAQTASMSPPHVPDPLQDPQSATHNPLQQFLSFAPFDSGSSHLGSAGLQFGLNPSVPPQTSALEMSGVTQPPSAQIELQVSSTGSEQTKGLPNTQQPSTVFHPAPPGTAASGPPAPSELPPFSPNTIGATAHHFHTIFNRVEYSYKSAASQLQMGRKALDGLRHEAQAMFSDTVARANKAS